jgi:uracil-DNA glycosylase
MADPLSALHDEIRTHGGCGFDICENATNIVPGEGSPTADVMLVGEAPGASEDKLSAWSACERRTSRDSRRVRPGT